MATTQDFKLNSIAKMQRAGAQWLAADGMITERTVIGFSYAAGVVGHRDGTTPPAALT
jgi:hypothetical protein